MEQSKWIKAKLLLDALFFFNSPQEVDRTICSNLSRFVFSVAGFRVMRSARNTLFPTLNLLLGKINAGPTLWMWVPHKIGEPTLILPNKRVSVRESVGKMVFLALLLMEKVMNFEDIDKFWFEEIELIC